jgi:hypothetical protein
MSCIFAMFPKLYLYYSNLQFDTFVLTLHSSIHTLNSTGMLHPIVAPASRPQDADSAPATSPASKVTTLAPPTDFANHGPPKLPLAPRCHSVGCTKHVLRVWNTTVAHGVSLSINVCRLPRRVLFIAKEKSPQAALAPILLRKRLESMGISLSRETKTEWVAAFTCLVHVTKVCDSI